MKQAKSNGFMPCSGCPTPDKCAEAKKCFKGGGKGASPEKAMQAMGKIAAAMGLKNKG